MFSTREKTRSDGAVINDGFARTLGKEGRTHTHLKYHAGRKIGVPDKSPVLSPCSTRSYGSSFTLTPCPPQHVARKAPPRRGRTALIREHARGQARQGRVLGCRATGLVGARAVVGRLAACIRSCPLLRERRDRWRSWFHFLLYPLSYSKGSTPSRAIYEFTQN